MATAQTMINDALMELNVLAEGDTPTAAMTDGAFRELNRIMDLLSNDQSFAYHASLFSMALTGQSSFTVGPTGDVITNRPIKIDTAWVDRGGISYPVRVVDNQKFDSIIYKGAAGANTTTIYYEGLVPDGKVNLWPIATGCTLNCRVLDLVDTFPTLATTLLMPPGYETLLIASLAINLSPQYPTGILSPITLQRYKSAKKAVGNINNIVPTMGLPTDILPQRGGSLQAFLGGY
jgi:hypothetical protein